MTNKNVSRSIFRVPESGRHKEIFFAGDLHLYHVRGVQFRKDYFSSVEDMNETIIRNWNETVSDKDLVYVVGDVYLDGNAKTAEKYHEIMSSLNGEKKLIVGNHDNFNAALESGSFSSVERLMEVRHKKKLITICHYPLESFNGSGRYSSMHLHAHTHKQRSDKDTTRRACVSIDAWGFRPVSLTQILDFMKTKSALIDHHGESVETKRGLKMATLTDCDTKTLLIRIKNIFRICSPCWLWPYS